MGEVAELRLRRDVTGLIRMLEAGSPMEKMAAAETLGDLHLRDAVTALIATVERGQEDPYGSYAAAEALGKFGDERAVGPLINAVVRNDYSNAVAARALGCLGAQSAIGPLVSALTGDGPADREAMAEALADLGARDALLSVAADDVNGGMISRWPAIRALVALQDTRVIDVLTALSLGGDYREVEVARALGRLGARRGIGRLAWNLHSDDDELRRASVEALGALAEHAGLPFILRTLGDESPAVQDAAARAAAAVPGAYGPLTYALWDEEPRVRAGACEALRLLGDARAARWLCHHMQLVGQPYFVRRAAAAALAVLPEEPCRADIVMRLAREADTAEDEERRLRAVELLGALATAHEVGELIRRLADQRPRVRLVVVEALTRLGDPAVGPALTSALSDESASVRARAARALGDRPGSDAVEGLIRALHDSSTDVAVRAAESLGRLRAVSATAVLWQAHAKGPQVLRRAAAGALVEVLAAGDPDKLRPFLDDEDREIQVLAASALDGRAVACVGRLAEILRGADLPAAMAAIRALGRIGTEGSVVVLDEKLRSRGFQYDAKKAATESLRVIGTQAAIRALASSYEQNTFIDNAGLHYAAREALIALGA
jgi:HEAT repeat protein